MTDKAGIARRFTESVARPIAAADAAPTEQWMKGTVQSHDPLTVHADGSDHQVEDIGYAPPIGTEVWVRFGAGQAPLALVAPPAPFAMAAGRTDVSTSSSVTGTASATFPVGRFTEPPVVTVMGGGNSKYLVTADTPTTSGVTFTIRHAAGSAVTSTVAVNWIAVQMTADSAEG